MKRRFVVTAFLTVFSVVAMSAFDVPTHRAVTLAQLATITATVSGQTVRFSQRALQQVADANEATDNTASAALFHPERHFTNEAFTATSAALADLRTRILAAVRANPRDGTTARQHLGRALHGIQDFYAHSNWVELGNGGPLTGLGTTTFANPPAALAACPANPNVLGPGGGGGPTSGYYLGLLGCSSSLPAGKCYHGNYTSFCPGINKDKPGFPNHGAARGVAEQATLQFVQALVNTLAGEDEAIMALLDVKGTTGFVIDDTGSMSATIGGVKSIVGQIVNHLNSNPDLKPTNWLMERFGDPDIGPPFVTTSASALLGAVNGLSAGGGGDCPELSQGGLLQAIDAALPTSNLMLFTDASAKDSGLANTVVAKAKAKSIVINYALVGSCSPVDPAYLKGAAETGGYLFFMQPGEEFKLFDLFLPQLTGDLVRINALNGTIGAGGSVNSVPVDSSIKRLLILVNTGLSNTVTLKRPSGEPVIVGDAGVRFTNLSGGDRIILVDTPAPGAWTVEIGGSGAYSLIADGNSPLEFYRFDFVQENSDLHGGYFPIEGLPLANSTVIGQATVLGPASTATFTLVDENGATLGPVSLTQNFPNAGADRYLGSFALPPVPFRVAVSGVDNTGLPYRRISRALYRGQSVGLAVELAAAGTIEAGGTTTFDVTVRNVGADATFTFTAVADAADVGVGAAPSSLTIDTGATATTTLTVQAPPNAAPGSTIVVTITGTSTADPGITNSASVELTVITPDVTAPELTLPSTITVPATSPAGAVVTYAALALDDVDGVVTVTCMPATGLVFPRGTTTVNCSAADSRGNTATGSFLVNVVNSPPVANPDTAQSAGGAVQITVLANDTDADGGTLAVTAVGTAAHGTAVLGAGGVVTYTPASGFSGTDTFTYAISDGQGGSGSGVVTVTVTAAPASGSGLMYGAGHIDSGSTHHHFLFIVTRVGTQKFGRVKYWAKAADRCDDDNDDDDGHRWDSVRQPRSEPKPPPSHDRVRRHVGHQRGLLRQSRVCTGRRSRQRHRAVQRARQVERSVALHVRGPRHRPGRARPSPRHVLHRHQGPQRRGRGQHERPAEGWQHPVR